MVSAGPAEGSPTSDIHSKKKRRSFFASALPLPTPAPTSRAEAPPTASLSGPPSDQVLAALSTPDEIEEMRTRLNGQKRKRDAAIRASERGAEALEGEDYGDEEEEEKVTRRRTTLSRIRSATSVEHTRSQSEEEEDSPPPSRTLRARTSIGATTSDKGSRQTPTAGPSKPRTRVSRTEPATPPKSKMATRRNTDTKAGKSGRGGRRDSAAGAQSSNERLSILMMKSMRATIDGRLKPYERVPVWQEPSGVKKGRRVTKAMLEAAAKGAVPSRANGLGPGSQGKGKGKAPVRSAPARQKSTRESVGREDSQPTTPKSKAKAKAQETGKEFMSSGFYCQDADAKSPFKLVNKVLDQQPPVPVKRGRGRPKGSKNFKTLQAAGLLTFPPLPYDHGYELFFGQEHDFVLPYDIHTAATSGALNHKKKPAPYNKIRSNVFPERARSWSERAVCECEPSSGCGDRCINRIMNYLCGKNCPCGDKCTNRSLHRRVGPATKVKYTGARGFGLFAEEDIKEGDFVIDYRGEVVSLNMFYGRITSEYAGQRNYYALAYDQDEVIDAGMRGNDARFINHGCDPNLEVHKFQTLGDGSEEYEVGLWAIRDIKKGEELFYNYNFDSFGSAENKLRAQCHCGAPKCAGYLGFKSGDKVPASAIMIQRPRRSLPGTRPVGRPRKHPLVVKPIVKHKPATRSMPGARISSVARKESEEASRPGSIAKVAKQPGRWSGAKRSMSRSRNDEAAQEVDAVQDVVTQQKESGMSGFPPMPSDSPDAVSSGLIATPPSPGGASNASEDSVVRRKSGWEKWSHRIASKPRTLEEWEQERVKRRRGFAWMNLMIAEFGLVPSADNNSRLSGRESAGSVGSRSHGTGLERGYGAMPLSSSALSEKRRLDETHAAEEGGNKKRHNNGDIPFPASMAEKSTGPASTMSSNDAEGSDESSRKRKAIAKRNGAPMGWVYLDDDEDGDSDEEDGERVPVDLPRSARRARVTAVAGMTSTS